MFGFVVSKLGLQVPGDPSRRLHSDPRQRQPQDHDSPRDPDPGGWGWGSRDPTPPPPHHTPTHAPSTLPPALSAFGVRLLTMAAGLGIRFSPVTYIPPPVARLVQNSTKIQPTNQITKLGPIDRGHHRHFHARRGRERRHVLWTWACCRPCHFTRICPPMDIADST